MRLPAVALSLVFSVLSCSAEELKLHEAPDSEWRATGELAKLLKKMRESSAASQEVFEALSAQQMNWSPPDGSHTPRWNAEHMTGRQLLFFSQIYAAIDPENHRVIDINPEQMPPDYAPEHPEWSGAEEARRMLRVSRYVQSHAHLLEGLDLDTRAPGSRWELRKLLEQMDRHFDEHTANVEKKFEFSGWPVD